MFFLVNLIVLLFLLCLNGAFAMSEFALISARKTRLQRWSEDGNKNAAAALELAENPQRFLSTVQIGITLVGVVSGAFGGARISGPLSEMLEGAPLIGNHAHGVAITLVVVLITYLSLISELVPKRLALNSPERLATAVARPMRVISRIASPAVHLLSISTNFCLGLFRIRASDEPPVTEEEIRVLMAQATVAGVFQEAEQEMVERVFRLADRRVRAMMTPRNKIIWLDINDSLEEIRRRIDGTPHSIFPVAAGRLGALVGIVHVRQIVDQTLAGRPIDLKTALRKPLFVHEGTHVLKVMERFRETGMQMAIVVDEYGAIEGLVTLTDILEGLVGGLPSPEEDQEPSIVQREDGSWLIDGMLPVDELKDLLKIRKMPEEFSEGFDTLGGLVMTYLKRVPVSGDSFECCGYRFEIVDMDGKRVDKVLVERVVVEEEEEEGS